MTVTIDLVFVLLAVAVAVFLIAGFVRRWAKPWMIPLGLALLAAATLVEWKF